MSKLLTFEEWKIANHCTPQHISEVVGDIYEIDMDGKSIDDVIKVFTGIKEKYPNATIEYRYYGYEGAYDIHIINHRLETQEEMDNILVEPYNRYVNKYKRELSNYQKLKKQFEGDV